MKKHIFLTAWQFHRQTGCDFSECMRKAWQLAKLQKRMKAEIVRFYYTKVNGERREAWGTLRPDIVPQTAQTDRKPNKTVFTYFDTEVNEFRCFKKFNLSI